MDIGHVDTQWVSDINETWLDAISGIVGKMHFGASFESCPWIYCQCACHETQKTPFSGNGNFNGLSIDAIMRRLSKSMSQTCSYAIDQSSQFLRSYLASIPNLSTPLLLRPMSIPTFPTDEPTYVPPFLNSPSTLRPVPPCCSWLALPSQPLFPLTLSFLNPTTSAEQSRNS